MGKKLLEDKVLAHSFGDVYCEIFERINDRARGMKDHSNRVVGPFRMLEIGFGCGHHNNGVSAVLWKTYFTEHGPGVTL